MTIWYTLNRDNSETFRWNIIELQGVFTVERKEIKENKGKSNS